MTTKKNTNSAVVGTSRGKAVTDADIEQMAAEAEAGYDVSTLRPRGGRPPMGSGPAEVVPVRLDPELRAAVEARATADETTTSEIIREALRRFLHVA
jgi:Ribbon-helix-helix protein, copG family